MKAVKSLFACALGALGALMIVGNTVDAQPGRMSPQGGTITGVTAGSGLTGGATSGPATVNVGAGSGISVTSDTVTIDPTYTQRRVSGTCSAGNAIRVIAQDGTVTCESAGAGVSGMGTSGTIPKWTGSSTLGDSLITESGTGISVSGDVTATDDFFGESLDMSGTGTFGVSLSTDGNATLGSDSGDAITLNGVTTANATITTGDTRGAWISPAAITGNVDDWAPTGLSGARNIYVALSGNATIRSITGGADGRELTLCNSHATNTITFGTEAGTGTAANKIRMPGAAGWKLYGTTYFAANGQPECVTLVYNGTIARWIMKSWASNDIPTIEILGTSFLSQIAGTPNFTASVTSTANWTLGDGVTDTVTVSGDLTVNDTSSFVGNVTSQGNWTFGNATTDTVTVSGDLTVNDSTNFNGTANVVGNSESDYLMSWGTLAFAGQDPTINSCGTGASVTGEAQSFKVTVGTGATTCVINFNRTFNSAPFCVVGAANGSADLSTTPLEINSTTTTVSLIYDTARGQQYNVFCPDRR